MSVMMGVLDRFFVSRGGLPGMKRISKLKESENQKDNANVTLFYPYDRIVFDVGWPRHRTGKGRY